MFFKIGCPFSSCGLPDPKGANIILNVALAYICPSGGLLKETDVAPLDRKAGMDNNIPTSMLSRKIDL